MRSATPVRLWWWCVNRLTHILNIAHCLIIVEAHVLLRLILLPSSGIMIPSVLSSLDAPDLHLWCGAECRLICQFRLLSVVNRVLGSHKAILQWRLCKCRVGRKSRTLFPSSRTASQLLCVPTCLYVYNPTSDVMVCQCPSQISVRKAASFLTITCLL